MLPRMVWLTLGHGCAVLGVAGLLLPVVPGAPFFILAAICYARGSRKFFFWLTRHDRVGPTVRRWFRHGTISWRAKGYAVGGMAAGASFSIWFAPTVPLQIGIACVVGLAAAFVLTRPSHPPA